MGTCLCECTVDAPMVDVLALYSEIDIFKDWFPKVSDAKCLKKVTSYRGLYQVKEEMPWPLWPRMMVFSATGVLDKKNKAVLTCMKTV